VTVERLSFKAANCSVAATLRIVGEKWTLLVLREAFYGLRRYEDFVEAIGCARNILSDRLGKLVEHGLLSRSPYRQEGGRERLEYRLTAKGRDLFPVLLALMQWGDRWLAGRKGVPVIVEHESCQAAVHAELRCAAGHGPLTVQDIVAKPGPGALPSTSSFRVARHNRLRMLQTKTPTLAQKTR